MPSGRAARSRTIRSTRARWSSVAGCRYTRRSRSPEMTTSSRIESSAASGFRVGSNMYAAGPARSRGLQPHWGMTTVHRVWKRQPVGGLIGLGFGHEGPRDRDPLPLASGELMGETVEVFGPEPNFLELFRGAVVRLQARREVVHDEGLGENVFDQHPGIQRGERVLEDGLEEPPE